MSVMKFTCGTRLRLASAALVLGIVGGCGADQGADWGDDGEVSEAREAITTSPIGFAALTQSGASGRPFGQLPYVHTKAWSGHQSSFSRNEGGDPNHDWGNFLATDANGDHVMLDLVGPGSVYRMWFTGTTPSALLKVYFDGEATPRISKTFSDFFGGASPPFTAPLVADNDASSGGFVSYVPLPFAKSIRITTNDPTATTRLYYNIDYQTFDPDTSVSTWTGAEDGSAALALWNSAGDDPNAGSHFAAPMQTWTLSSAQTVTLWDASGPASLSAIKLNIPGIQPDQRMETDDGRAHKGQSTFNMTINPANQGVVLIRRVDFGIGNQKAQVFVDNTLVGTWFDSGLDLRDHWRDSSFSIPATSTAGKSSINVKISFVSSDIDWNEFKYSARSLMSGGGSLLTDVLDVGDPTSESNHQYAITTPTFQGTKTFSYPSQYNITDHGSAHHGTSQLTNVAIDPGNQGVVITRRIDYSVADQAASVYVDGVFAGNWSTPGSDAVDKWRDVSFAIPASFTAGKSQITLKFVVGSSVSDWNEFKYWIYSRKNGTEVLTDRVEVGFNTSPKYSVTGSTWSGERTFTYPSWSKSAAILNNLWLQAYWNGEASPSVNAPIGMFFGMGQFGVGRARGLLAGMAKDGTMYAYFPMPYQNHATLKLVNNGAAVSNVSTMVGVDTFAGPFTGVGTFRTSLSTVNAAAGDPDLVFLDVAGQGHLVGVVESVSGPTNRWNLEGDERIRVDGSRSPAVNGTGTEDFFNGGWYFDRGPFGRQTHGEAVNVLTATSDNTAAYRELISDLIPYRQSLRVSIQHGDPDSSAAVSATTLAHYYATTNANVNMILLDVLGIGNAGSEATHSYSISTQTWQGSRTYTFEGELFGTNVTASGRAHRGTSQFIMQIHPGNNGVVLRRLFDQGVGNQRAQVSVDGSLVGTWYRAGSNTFCNWREDDFVIPSAFTAGKSQITIKVSYVSSDFDWNEFQYSAFSLLP